MHNGKNWIIRGNVFRFIQNPGGAEEGPSEHAVHFWSDSANTLVERNLIMDCDRGIGFGLGDRGHEGGIIRNNMIYSSGSGAWADVGIGLENASNAQVYNNTIYFEGEYPHAIEIRFGGTAGGFVRNNLTNRNITNRDGGTAAQSSNVTDALASWVCKPSAGNLRLASAVAGVVDAGEAIEGLVDDFDGALRPVGERVRYRELMNTGECRSPLLPLLRLPTGTPEPSRSPHSHRNPGTHHLLRPRGRRRMFCRRGNLRGGGFSCSFFLLEGLPQRRCSGLEAKQNVF